MHFIVYLRGVTMTKRNVSVAGPFLTREHNIPKYRSNLSLLKCIILYIDFHHR